MPKTKSQKKEIIKKLEEKISQAKSIIFAGFNALGVKDNEQLRHNLKAQKGEYLVAKKTLINLAFKNKGIKDLEARQFDGKIAAVFAYEDELAPAKALDKFRKSKKENEEKIYFLGGILDGKLISQGEVEILAKLPDKEELYAKVVGALKSPLFGLVNVMTGNLHNLIYVLKAIEKQKNN